MRFRDTAGLFAAAVLAIGAMNIGCDSGASAEKSHESGASATDGQRPENAPVTGTGGSTTSAGVGVGSGGGTGAGAGRTSFDGTVDGSTTSKSGATSQPSKGAESGEAHKATAETGHSASGESK